jgi:hypothetical protein
MCTELKASKDWYELIPEENRPIIADPDGWNRGNFNFSFNEELITIEEFKRRLLSSTLMKVDKELIEKLEVLNFPLL